MQKVTYLIENIFLNLLTIVEYTLKKFAREKNAQKTDICEIKEFTKILFPTIVLVDKMYCGYGTLIFITISYDRLRFLGKCVRFDNISTRGKAQFR